MLKSPKRGLPEYIETSHSQTQQLINWNHKSIEVANDVSGHSHATIN